MIAQPQDNNPLPNRKPKVTTVTTKEKSANRVADSVQPADKARNPFQDFHVSSLYPESQTEVPARKTKAKAKKPSVTSKQKAKKGTKKPARKSAMRKLVERTAIDHRAYQLDAISDVLKMFSGKALDELGKRIEPVGSVMLEGSSGVGKSVIALMVASALQRKFGLTVAWSASPERLTQVMSQNEDLEIDVDLLTIDPANPNETETDLLIIDHGAMSRVEQLIAVHESADPQIVLGLCNPVFTNKGVRDCFDQVVSANGKRSSDEFEMTEKPGAEPLQYDDDLEEGQNGDLPVQMLLQTSEEARWV